MPKPTADKNKLKCAILIFLWDFGGFTLAGKEGEALAILSFERLYFGFSIFLLHSFTRTRSTFSQQRSSNWVFGVRFLCFYFGWTLQLFSKWIPHIVDRRDWSSRKQVVGHLFVGVFCTVANTHMTGSLLKRGANFQSGLPSCVVRKTLLFLGVSILMSFSLRLNSSFLTHKSLPRKKKKRTVLSRIYRCASDGRY